MNLILNYKKDLQRMAKKKPHSVCVSSCVGIHMCACADKQRSKEKLNVFSYCSPSEFS